ncbi:MAG TPA: hypothetical protein ENK91_09420 [Bacteroidetes bacterium]|nr:hypothetical protein [Bacteroidota bacterium]
MNKNRLIIIIFFSSIFFAKAQKLLISPELDTRNDLTFDLIGKVDQRIIALRDKGNKKVVNIYDKNLFRYIEKTLSLEDKKTDLIASVNYKNKFTVFYEVNYKNTKYIKAKSFNSMGAQLDSININEFNWGFSSKKYNHVVSEDFSKVLLYRIINNSEIEITVIDLKTFKKILDKKTKFTDLRLNFDYRQVEISNKGDIYFVFEKKASLFNKSGHKFFIKAFYASTGKKKQKQKTLKFNSSNLKIKYDNKNNILNITGLITKLYEVKTIGYYVFQYSEKLNIINGYKNYFKNKFLKEYYKLENNKQKKYIRNLKLKNIILRNDGGLVLLLEKIEIIKRRNNSYYSGQQYLYGDTDYNYESIVIFSIHDTGEEYWSKIIPKNQLSSNDYGIYSSFFAFNTSSFLNIIFNDEIKNNNQVILYSINPVGAMKRKSIFSTDTYNMNLTVSKAMQISASRIIIPSYKKDRLKLVSINF